MPSELTVRELQGSAIAAHIGDLARLRLAVFREFPYLYGGQVEAENEYLRRFADCPLGFTAIVFDGGRAVGAVTALPLAAASDSERAPFIAAGIDISRVCYFSEMVLLPAYRGRGLGRRFMAACEAFADRERLSVRVFCTVERPASHPSRPQDDHPWDDFWARCGFRRRSDLRTSFSWKDIDEPAETPKPMVFWWKDLLEMA